MLRSLAGLAVIFAAFASGVYAQDVGVRERANQQLHQVCIGQAAAVAEPDADAQCRCFANVVIEGWTDRELTLFSRVFAHYPDQEAASAELQRMIDEEGYTQADYASVGQRLERAADIVGERCEAAAAEEQIQ